MREEQVVATGATLVRLFGEHVVTLMAANPGVKGIDHVKARRISERFGSRLYEIPDGGDAAALAEVLAPECSEKAIKAWAKGRTHTSRRKPTHCSPSLRVGRTRLRYGVSIRLS